MTVHNCEVTFTAGFSINPGFRHATGSREDLTAIATRLISALDRAYVGKSPRALLIDHLDVVQVAKLTRGRKGRAVTVRSRRGKKTK